MKSDLIITRFKTEPTFGTKSYHEPRTFFGSKMMEIEDHIIIDNSIIQHSEIYDINNPNNNGYQYYDDIDYLEKIYLINLYDIKNDNHTINLLPQSDIDLENNTNWSLIINWRDILHQYLYFKLKESRVFKCIKYTDVVGENINLYIHNYINVNMLNRYKFDSINLYVEYKPLDTGDFNITPTLQFNPLFKINTKKDENLVKNANIIVFDELLNINYKQIKKSKDYKFDYYFDLNFTKI